MADFPLLNASANAAANEAPAPVGPLMPTQLAPGGAPIRHRLPGAEAADAGITLSQLTLAALWHVTAWPAALAEVEAALAERVDARPPTPGSWTPGADGAALVRTGPLAWLVLATAPEARAAAPQRLAGPPLDPSLGTALDLSHARTALLLAGPALGAVLARLVSVDTRPAAMAEGRAFTAPIHGHPVQWLARADGVALLLPRSFARGLTELTVETACPYGCDAG
ncbi:MAG: hypothetical protein AAF677_02030 [Pseudomonadota bacterium]